MTKPPKSFRIDPELIDKAIKAGLPIVEIFEAALANALKTKKCPYCGQEIKK